MKAADLFEWRRTFRPAVPKDIKSDKADLKRRLQELRKNNPFSHAGEQIAFIKLVDIVEASLEL